MEFEEEENIEISAEFMERTKEVTEKELYELLNERNTYPAIDEVPERIEYRFMDYILQQYYKSGKRTITIEELVHETGRIAADHLYSNLVNKGLMEPVNLDDPSKPVEYELTDLGMKVGEELKIIAARKGTGYSKFDKDKDGP